MDSAAWAGILGAAVGGACAIIAAFLAGRHQAKSVRDQWTRETAREAYVAYVAATMTVYEELHRFRLTEQNGRLTRDDARRVSQTLNGLLGNVRTAFVVWDMEAPESLRQGASDSLTAILAAVDFVRDAAWAGRSGSRFPFSEELRSRIAAADSALWTLREEVRAVMNQPLGL
ncbi:hypothetical protein [Streptomyces sp. NPDC005485]|uniref:hypothetical protein n=1 Tax=Streptomyces sp. NPDC005485 TaxID=3155591 RepID=UPI0033AB4B4F